VNQSRSGRDAKDIVPSGTKGTDKVVPVLFLNEDHAMNVYWGSGNIAPLIL
jgi:hypothetical protein